MASPLTPDSDTASHDAGWLGSPTAGAARTPDNTPPKRTGTKRAIADRSDKPRKQTNRLLEATELASARLRVTRDAIGLRCVTRGVLKTGPIKCNACNCEIADSARVPSKKEDSRIIRNSLFHPLWIGYHWKTFFCRECTRQAQTHFNAYFNLDRQCRSEQTENAACLNCLRVDYDQPATCLPICYASDHCAGRPRRIPLCDTCIAGSADQLALVSYSGPGGTNE